jgi:hypothetical protein
MITWENFLLLLSTPTAIPIVLGAVMSVVAEYVPGWGAMDARWKRAIFFGVSLAIPVLAAVLGVWTLGWSPSWAETFWPAIVAGFVAFGSGTLAHLPRLGK